MKNLLCLVPLLSVVVPLVGQVTAADTAAVRAELAQKAEREVRENILPFWLRHAPNQERGGFNGVVKADLSPVRSALRGSLLTSRILWTFSAAHRRYYDPQQLKMARLAYDDLVGRFWDEKNGGFYWTITADGKPLDTTKQIYGQAFGIYALSEYYLVTSDPLVLERAIALYRLVEKHAHDSVNGGYFEVFAQDWQKAWQRKSVVNPTAEKSQNTHLHVMEAYTNLLRVWPDAGLRANQKALLELMLTRIYDSKSHHLRLFLTDNWSQKSDRFSYGHDIEAAWLMTEAAQVLGDRGLIEQTRHVAVEIAETTLKEGVDRDGGVFNEGGPDGVSDSSKDWWPQAEAAVGFLDAYQISGDKRFLDAAIGSWAFIEKKLIDRKDGEWFQSVSQQGEPRRLPRISLWKCPYHNSRSCYEIIDRMALPEPKPGGTMR